MLDRMSDVTRILSAIEQGHQEGHRKKATRKVIGADGQGNPLVEVTEEVDIRLWNKVDALRLLAKVMGMYKRRAQPPPPLPRLGFDPDEG